MKKLITVLVLSFLLNPCFSQSQFVVRLASGPNTNNVGTTSIQQTAGGNYVIGSSNPIPSLGYQIYIAKLNNDLTIQWDKSIGGSSYNICFNHATIKTSDGGFAIAGEYRTSNGLDPAMLLLKLDGNGSIQWKKAVTSASGNDESALSVVQTSDNGYVLTGSSNTMNVPVVKYDAAGTLQWYRFILDCSAARTITQCSDGGYMIAASKGFDVNIIKLSSSGAFEWGKSFTPYQAVNGIYSVKQTTDGGYIFAGMTYLANNYSVGIAIRLDASGNVQWAKFISLNNYGEFRSVIQTPDGGYLFSGRTYMTLPNIEVYIVKLDNNGTLQWSRTFGETTWNEESHSTIRTNDGGYVVGASKYSSALSQSRTLIIKVDANWNSCLNLVPQTSTVTNLSNFTSITKTVSAVTPVVITPVLVERPGGVVFNDCSATGITQHNNNIPGAFELLQNHPNPFNPTTKIRFAIPPVGAQYIEPVQLVIYDILGREVVTLVNQPLSPGTYEVDFDASHLTSGIYYYRLSAGNFSETKKMIFLK